MPGARYAERETGFHTLAIREPAGVKARVGCPKRIGRRKSVFSSIDSRMGSKCKGFFSSFSFLFDFCLIAPGPNPTKRR